MSRFVKPLQSISRLSDRVGGGGGKKTLEIVSTRTSSVNVTTSSFEMYLPTGAKPGDALYFVACVANGILGSAVGCVNTSLNYAAVYGRRLTGTEGPSITVSTTSSPTTAAYSAVLIRNGVVAESLGGKDMVFQTSTSTLFMPSRTMIREKLMVFAVSLGNANSIVGNYAPYTQLARSGNGPSTGIFVHDSVQDGFGPWGYGPQFSAGSSSYRAGIVLPLISYQIPDAP